MSNFEQKFWKTVTWFGELPGIFIPVSFTCIVTIGSILNSARLSDGSLIVLGGHYADLMIALLLSCLGVFLSYSIGTIIKYFYYKPRPVPRDTSTLRKRINAGSMPSIHSSNALITAISLIITARSLLPQSQLISSIIRVGGLSYYGSIALSRITLKKHYPIDVVAGTMLGVIVILFVVSMSDLIIGSIEPIIYHLLPYLTLLNYA